MELERGEGMKYGSDGLIRQTEARKAASYTAEAAPFLDLILGKSNPDS